MTLFIIQLKSVWLQYDFISFSLDSIFFSFCVFYLSSLFFVCLSWMSLLNIWGHITMVPTCSNGPFTNALPHRNAMLRTQDMTPHPITVYRHGAIYWCGTSNWNTQLPILMSLVRSDRKTFPDLPNTPANVKLYDAVVGQKLGRKCTVPTGSWTQDLWCANPLHYPLAHSCLS